MWQKPSSISILGVRVDIVDWTEVELFCHQALIGQEPRQLVTVNGEFILEARRNAVFKHVINQADLVIADSTNVVWASRWLGKPLKAKTPGSDLTDRLARLAKSSDKSLFLLGGKPGIATRAAKVLEQNNPGLIIAGTSSADPDDLDIVNEICASKANIVLVAYGAPKQEIWIKEHANTLGAQLLVGVGGTFDMLAGLTPRAPQWLRHLNLEWLWRLILQPSRMKRIINSVIIFPLTVISSRRS